MSKLLNKGVHHTNVKSAKKCDFAAELRKVYEQYVAENQNDYNEDIDIDDAVDFQHPSNPDSLIELIFSLWETGYLKQDIAIYGGPALLKSSTWDMSKYSNIISFTKPTGSISLNNGSVQYMEGYLQNGANVILFYYEGEESPSNMVSALYFDGSELKFFTPYEGNGVNVDYQSAIGDEDYTNLDEPEGDGRDYFAYLEEYDLGDPYNDEIYIDLDMQKIVEEIANVLGK